MSDLSTEDYAAGDFVLSVHIVTEDESPLDIDTTGGYQTVVTDTVLTPIGRNRYDILPQPWFGDTFTKVPNVWDSESENGSDIPPTNVTDVEL